MVRKFWNRLKRGALNLSHPFRKTYTANICGHHTKKTGCITPFSETLTMSMPLEENGNPDYCLECIAKMSIHCAWCEAPIDIGDPVTLYTPQEHFLLPEHAVRYHDDPRHFVGCLRWDCADGGIDRAGFWMPPGKVHRVPSPLEMVLTSGNAVIVNNLHDPNDLGEIIEK